MDQDFEQVFEGLRIAGEGLLQAIGGLKGAADAARHAADEHGDLRESVMRLEALVLELLEEARRRRGPGDRQQPPQ